jgi:hypothetical protein
MAWLLLLAGCAEWREPCAAFKAQSTRVEQVDS